MSSPLGWTAIAVLAAGAYAAKALGLVAAGGRRLPTGAARGLALLPAAVLSGLIVVQTVGAGQGIGVDARLAGVAAGVVAVALRAPFWVVIVVAAAVTATLRAVLG